MKVESHVAIYDLSTGRAIVRRDSIPLESAVFGKDAHGYVCDSSGTFDVIDGKYLDPRTRASLLSKSFASTCTALRALAQRKYPKAPDGLAAFSAVPQNCLSEGSLSGFVLPKDIQYSCLSPSGERAIYFWLFNRLYFAERNSKDPPLLLAGGTLPTTRMEFVRSPVASAEQKELKDFILASALPGLSTFWNFHDGEVRLTTADVRFSQEPKKPIAAFMIPAEANGTGSRVTLQNMTTYENRIVNIPSKERPQWYGISADGNTVIMAGSKTLTAFRAGTSKELSCADGADFLPLDLSGLGLLPESTYLIDRTGSYLVGLCGRKASNARESGLSPFLVIWDLRTLEEKTQVSLPNVGSWINTIGPGASSLSSPAESVLWMSSSYDRRHIALTTNTKIILIDLETGAVSEVKKADLGLSVINGAILGHEGHTMILAGATLFSSHVYWYDLQSKQLLRTVDATAGMTTFTADENDDVALATNDNVITIFSSEGKRLLRLITSAPSQPGGNPGWVALTDDGLFDGTPDVMELVGYTGSNETVVRNLNTLYNELDRPLLLQQLAFGQLPRLDPDISLSTYLEVPNLSVLLEKGDVTPITRNGKATLCVNRLPVFEALLKRVPVVPPPTLESDDASDCPRRLIISDQTNPAAEVQALRHLSTPVLTNPWPRAKMSDKGGTIHVLTVAVRNYSGLSQLPPVPTAASSAKALENLFRRAPASQPVRVWGSDGCAQDLIDQNATKANILGCISRIIAAAKPEDIVVLFLMGHGGPLNNSEFFYYFPVDYAGDPSHDYPSTAISSAELAVLLRSLQARRLVLIIDTCNAGASLDAMTRVAQSKISQELAAYASRDQVADQEGGIRGSLFVAAATGLEEVTASRNVNPFVDRILQLLGQNGKTEDVVWSADVLGGLQAPIVATGLIGAGDTSIHPVAISVGANFPIRTVGR